MSDLYQTLERCGVMPDVIHIADIGAMETGAPDQWDALIDRGRARLLGFEPQKEECDRCNAVAGEGRLYLPVALGDGTTRPFHLCQYAATSSFYRPNVDVIARYEHLEAQMEVIRTEPMPTTRLDDVEQARQIDFIKLDTQGAELDILAHATETLNHVGMIQTEACFLQLYKDQPVFADIDAFMRDRGFAFHTFTGFGGRALKPLTPASAPAVYPKQFLWSDAVYLKTIDQEQADLDPTMLLKRAILLHEIYQSYDFAARDLRDYDRITGQRAYYAYASMLRELKAA